MENRNKYELLFKTNVGLFACFELFVIANKKLSDPRVKQMTVNRDKEEFRSTCLFFVFLRNNNHANFLIPPNPIRLSIVGLFVISDLYYFIFIFVILPTISTLYLFVIFVKIIFNRNYFILQKKIEYLKHEHVFCAMLNQ
jgi:hypothetical protein